MKKIVEIEAMIKRTEDMAWMYLEDALKEEKTLIKNMEIRNALEWRQTAEWLKELKESKQEGEWLESDEPYNATSKCSKCGHSTIKFMYCPYCGTKMKNWNRGEVE